jgi:rubredoxin
MALPYPVFTLDQGAMLRYKGPSMKKYQCTACDYEYDPALGDPEHGIPAGTAFEDLPEDWRCPVCGISKYAFVPMDEP